MSSRTIFASACKISFCICSQASGDLTCALLCQHLDPARPGSQPEICDDDSDNHDDVNDSDGDDSECDDSEDDDDNDYDTVEDDEQTCRS